MGITKKELRDIIKEEVLKELQRLDEVNYVQGRSAGVGGGSSTAPGGEQLRKARDRRLKKQADRIIATARGEEAERNRYLDKLKAQREEESSKEDAVMAIQKEARQKFKELLSLNKKGCFTRNTPIGGNWEEQRNEVMKELVALKDKLVRLIPDRGLSEDRASDYWLGAAKLKDGKVYTIFAMDNTSLEGPNVGWRGNQVLTLDNYLSRVRAGEA